MLDAGWHVTVERGNGWTMYHGDCLEVVRRIKRPDRVITDPPYGFGHYATDDASCVVEALGLTKTASSHAIFGFPEVLVGWLLELGWGVPDEWIVWWPTNAAPKAGGRARGIPRQTEHVAIFGQVLHADQITQPRSEAGVKNKANIAAALGPTVRMGDVWRDASPGIAFNYADRLHPNEKPVDFLLRLVTLLTDPGETILDPFAGSGTTGVACLRLGRRFIGVERDEKYFRLACDRLRAEEQGSTLQAQRAGQEPLFR